MAMASSALTMMFNIINSICEARSSYTHCAQQHLDTVRFTRTVSARLASRGAAGAQGAAGATAYHKSRLGLQAISSI
uniref:Uncharacterized protein n=1 Tax=Pandoraea thiooxydans TaxID=445709 RepID=A0A0U4DE42_9BURK